MKWLKKLVALLLTIALVFSYPTMIAYAGYYKCGYCGYNLGSTYVGVCGGCGRNLRSYAQAIWVEEEDTPVSKTQLSRPTGLSATALSSSQIRVNLPSLDSRADHFTVLCATSTSKLNLSSADKIINTSSTSCTFTGLTGATKYYFCAGFTVLGSDPNYESSGWSSSVSATTQDPVTYISAPTITLTPTSATQINVGWSSTTATTSYTLQWSTSSSMSNASTETVTTTSYSITNLLPNTTYYVRIKSNVTGTYYASNGYGSTKNAKTLQDPLSSPTLGNCSITDCSTLLVEYTMVPNATGYVIEYSTEASFISKESLII